MVLGILFLTFSHANIWFGKKKLMWRSYTTKKNLFSIKGVEFIDKKQFAIVVLNENSETFVMQIVALEAKLLIPIHFTKITQIALLKAKKAPLRIFTEYSKYTNIFSPNLVI